MSDNHQHLGSSTNIASTTTHTTAPLGEKKQTTEIELIKSPSKSPQQQSLASSSSSGEGYLFPTFSSATSSTTNTNTNTNTNNTLTSSAPVSSDSSIQSDLDFMSDWKSFAAKATSSFNDASASISETLRESGVNDVVASTSTNVKYYANSAYDLSANAASKTAEFTTNAAKDTMSALQSLDRERIAWSMAFTFVSGLSLTLAFTIGIATIALFPAKFALCFSLFSISNICAVGALRGANQQIKHMLDPERLWVSCSLVGTILFTLWSALVKHSYFLTVLASIAQSLALLYYQLSFFPMGADGFKVVCKVAISTVVKPAFQLAVRFIGLILPLGSSSGGGGHSRRRSNGSMLPI